jgi:hypothetical protein
MHHIHYVILSADTDCDGTSISAHRVNTPRDARMSEQEVINHARASEQLSTYAADGAFEVLTMAAFRQSDSWSGLDEWHREYFHTDGYATISQTWNPWVYDDTIGTVLYDSGEDW